jgi:hypothetical protein
MILSADYLTDIAHALARPCPCRVFRLRCQAHALLVREGYSDFHEAVDCLQKAAVFTEVVKHLGQDAVQAIMAESFREVATETIGADHPEVAA